MKKLTFNPLEMMLLHLLQEKPRYGYEMMEQIRQRSGDTFLLQAGTLYPVLHGLEAKGCITSQEQVVEQGRARRFYFITETGLKQLALQKNQWDAFRRAVERTMEE